MNLTNFVFIQKLPDADINDERVDAVSGNYHVLQWLFSIFVVFPSSSFQHFFINLIRLEKQMINFLYFLLLVRFFFLILNTFSHYLLYYTNTERFSCRRIFIAPPFGSRNISFYYILIILFYIVIWCAIANKFP